MARRPAQAPRREDLEHAIEAAIAALDALDGEADFEPEETDHSSSEDDFDRIEFARDAALMVDNEPSLGSLNCIGVFVSPSYVNTPFGSYDQTRWAGGETDDRERED